MGVIQGVCTRCGQVLSSAGRCPSCDPAGVRSGLDARIGTTIGGRYRILQRVGAGGMASVYLARHVLIDRLVAVKTLRPELARDPVQRDRFLREARAVNRIHHPNIVEITDVGETEDGVVYLVMEYVPGESLLDHLAEAPFDSRRMLDIAAQIASALSRAHEMGVIHRDLKPENVLLVPEAGRELVKVLDFGIAKITDAPSLTGSQQLFGTPGYIAPEYVQSAKLDGRADLYSLGVLMYEMVTGVLPFDYEFPGDLLVKHVVEPPIPPSRRNPRVEPAVEELVLRALAKNPDQRFRDAHHFLDELERVRERLGSDDSWGAMGAPSPSDTEPATRVEAADTDVDLVRPGGPDRGSARPSIPRAPRDTLSIARDAAKEGGVDSTLSASYVDGLIGGRRWRRRFEALRDALDDIELEAPLPAEIARERARASGLYESLVRDLERTESIQAELDAMDANARRYRAELGRRADDRARELSTVKGALEAANERRLAELAGSTNDLAADAAVVGLVERIDVVTRELDTLRAELETHAEQHEDARGPLCRASYDAVAGLESVTEGLRDSLARIEAFVEAWWNRREGRRRE
ncbi:MAG: protein kinase [Polyangiales bacterium]